MWFHQETDSPRRHYEELIASRQIRNNFGKYLFIMSMTFYCWILSFKRWKNFENIKNCDKTWN